MKIPLYPSPSVILALLFPLLLSCCTVQYVAEYDASVKDEIISVAKRVDLFWGTLLDSEATQRPYAQYQEQYNQIESDIRSLMMRNAIRPLNKASTRQGEIALKLWQQDHENHKANDTISDFIAKRHREQFTRVFTAMAMGEEAKNPAAGSGGTKPEEGNQ